MPHHEARGALLGPDAILSLLVLACHLTIDLLQRGLRLANNACSLRSTLV